MRRGITAAALSVAILAPGCGGESAPNQDNPAKNPAGTKVETRPKSESDRLIEGQLVSYMGRLASKVPRIEEGKPIKYLMIKGLEVRMGVKGPNTHLSVDRALGKYGKDRTTTDLELEVDFKNNDPSDVAKFALTHSIMTYDVDKNGKVPKDEFGAPFSIDLDDQVFTFERFGGHWTARDCELGANNGANLCSANKTAGDIEAIFYDMRDSFRMLTK